MSICQLNALLESQQTKYGNYLIYTMYNSTDMQAYLSIWQNINPHKRFGWYNLIFTIKYLSGIRWEKEEVNVMLLQQLNKTSKAFIIDSSHKENRDLYMCYFITYKDHKK